MTEDRLDERRGRRRAQDEANLTGEPRALVVDADGTYSIHHPQRVPEGLVTVVILYPSAGGPLEV